jgi:phytoene dehydrogenase-like protein
MNVSTVLIIGGGLAGLSAGCYLQLSGFTTELFEAHNQPGGLLTGWARNGYTIDGCIHGFLGSSKHHPYYQMWNELLPMDEIQFLDYDQMYVFMFEDGQDFVIYSDLDRFLEYVLALSPEDRVPIQELVHDTKAIGKLDLSSMIKPRELYGVLDYLSMLRMLPALRLMRKWNKVTVESFSKRITHPLLRKAVRYFLSPVLMHMFVHSAMDQKVSGYPAIGSLGISKLLAKKYADVGGTLHTRSKVKKILVENDTAVGLTLQDDTHVKGDLIISAMDLHSTVHELLDGKYIDEPLHHAMTTLRLNSSRLQVSLGVSMNSQEIPHSFKIILDEPVTIGTEPHTYIDVLCYNEDTNTAPAGKTLFIIQIVTRDYDHWIRLRATDRAEYSRQKKGVADIVITILEKKLGALNGKIEMVDITTPATYHRYTNNRKGSIQGWDQENLFQSNPFKKQLSNLENFYLTGHWVEPGGGVPTAFKSGRDVAQIVCKHENKKFFSLKSATA